jgi:predicted nucleic acid-binding protein
MRERIVINTGPLVALGRAGVTEAMAKMPLDFLAPREVEREIQQGPAAGHQPVDISWVRFMPLAQPISALAVSTLDEGEAAVIQLALDEGVPLVCIDERKGRRAALAVGLKVTGTLGLLGRAKGLELIPAVRPFVERMVTGGDWFDPELLARFYAAIGE